MEKRFVNVEEVLSDDMFLEWYFNIKPGKRKVWEEWMAANPQQTQLVDEAAAIMDQLYMKEAPVPDQQIEMAFDKINKKLKEKNNTDPAFQLKLRRNRWWIAAAAVLLLVASITFYKFSGKKESIATTYGQISKHQLPDGSEVMLNANSGLTLGKGFNENKDREVWVNGEAFFKVQKTATKSRFIVHTHRFDIIVTGTQFNVVDRPEVTNVMLKEGSITIRTNEGEELKMLPGDFIEFTGSKPLKKDVKSDNVLAWRDKRIIFENTSLNEVLKRIETHYGVMIRLDDESIGHKTITGILPNDNLEVLLESLEATLDFKVIRNKNEIIISTP